VPEGVYISFFVICCKSLFNSGEFLLDGSDVQLESLCHFLMKVCQKTFV